MALYVMHCDERYVVCPSVCYIRDLCRNGYFIRVIATEFTGRSRRGRGAGGLALSFLSENFTQKSDRWPVLLTSYNKSQAILCRTLRFEKLRTVFGHIVCFATTTMHFH